MKRGEKNKEWQSKVKKSLKYLLSIASLSLTSCFAPNNSINLEEKIGLHKTRIQPEKKEYLTYRNYSLGTFSLKPDRVRIGLMLPVGISLENFDTEIKNTNRLASFISSDLTLSSPKDDARKGEIYIPQIEFEHFLNEDFSFFWRIGGNYDHSKGADTIYPFFLPIKSKVKIETKAGVITSAIGIDYYPKMINNEYFDLFLGLGVEGHYFFMEQEWSAEILGVPIYEDDREISGFGATAFARAGIEVKPWDPLKLIPDDLSFSAAGEYHKTLFSVLGNDPDGFRLMLYVGIPLGN